MHCKTTTAFRSFLYLLLAYQAAAADVFYTFNVANNDIAPDGSSRQAILINNKFPGTLIQASKNDTLHIMVNDQQHNPAMRQSTSIVSLLCYIVF